MLNGGGGPAVCARATARAAVLITLQVAIESLLLNWRDEHDLRIDSVETCSW